MAVVLRDVRTFDGAAIGDPAAASTGGADVVDAGGAVLLPGLSDAHVHLLSPDDADPLVDIAATRRIQRIRCAGEELAPARE